VRAPRRLVTEAFGPDCSTADRTRDRPNPRHTTATRGPSRGHEAPPGHRQDGSSAAHGPTVKARPVSHHAVSSRRTNWDARGAPG
jgi:hypothetical protein